MSPLDPTWRTFGRRHDVTCKHSIRFIELNGIVVLALLRALAESLTAVR